MTGLVLAIAASVLGSAAHFCLLRQLPTSWRLLALPPLLLIALGALALLAPIAGGRLDLAQIFVALVLSLSLGFAYALVLAGIVYDSPTLSIVNEIESYGSAGMPAAAFAPFAAARPFVQSRLDALIAVGEIATAGDDLILTGRTVVLLELGDAYRRLRGGQSTEAG